MIRHIINIKGVVQGVGFRPFVSTLANTLGIVGFVKNVGSSVYIDAQGRHKAMNEFERKLTSDAPKLSHINSVSIDENEVTNYIDFQVLESDISLEDVFIPPDVGMCEACENELFDSNSRRFLYPFTVCSHCGPRYSLIEGVPYDRAKTSMKKFEMCSFCESEYLDIENRRYRCEPICCPNCGPSLILADKGGSIITNDNSDAIKQARKLLNSGKILAIKGIGGFHLACNAFDFVAVKTLRERKKRDGKPFAVMAKDIETIQTYCKMSEFEKRLISSSQKPIVLLEKFNMDGIADDISKNIGTLAVMLPYTPLHRLIFDYPDGSNFPKMFVMTSGNISGEPICIDNEQAISRLGGIADYFLMHNRDILFRADDSIVREFDGQSLMLRRARGYVPQPIKVKMGEQHIFAAGSDLKNTFGISRGGNLYLSSHMGDLEDFETFNLYKNTINNYSTMLGISPTFAACDMHPSYHSTHFAKSQGLKIHEVQHHHAHIATCMAENEIVGEVIGVAFDGTGFGTDGSVWGGEFFVCSYNSFERIGHLKAVKMFGGDSVSSEPWKSAVSHIYDSFENSDDICKKLFDANYKTGIMALKSDINCHITSSCGRLFDAVSVICGIRILNEYEGQGAIEFEYLADKECFEEYEVKLCNDTPFVIDTTEIIRAVYKDVLDCVPVSKISARFHNTLAKCVLLVCDKIRKNRNLDKVCLGGGVFQNMLLMRRTVELLRQNDFKVFWNKKVPINDGGLALGQAVILNANLKG